jgi:telomerase reverse transcriptase
LLQVVDFVIWKLFNHNSGSYQRPQHLLAHGFQRPAMGRAAQDTCIPGVVSQFPNKNVETLKGGAWAEILGLLGSNGEQIMLQLLLDCGIFAAVNAQKGIYYQLSGMVWMRHRQSLP